MGFNEDFAAFKSTVKSLEKKFPDLTEEATKNALIMPFFSLLGYSVFNLDEFVPEYTCDVAMKKGEKVDYAIFIGGELSMLVETKKAGMKLQKQQQAQLYRYFSTNRCRIAILTNGVIYHFFSDINQPNIMDDDPFLSFDIINDDENVYLPSLTQFCKENFNAKDILSKAVYLKYANVVEKTIRKDLISPSNEIVKYFLSSPEINIGGRITSQMIEKYREITLATMRKVMGVTIKCDDSHTPITEIPVITDEAVPVPVPRECDENETLLKKIFGEDVVISVAQIYFVTAYSVFKNGKLIGKLCVSKKKLMRYNYTTYSDNGYKMFFLNSTDEIESII